MSKTLAEKIAVMQAAEQGKQIQFKGEHLNAWRDLSGCVWNWESNDYRIKPEPTPKELNDALPVPDGYEEFNASHFGEALLNNKIVMVFNGGLIGSYNHLPEGIHVSQCRFFRPIRKTRRMTVQELTDEVAKRRVWARNHTLQWFELNKLSKIKCVESDANLEISYDLKTWQKPEVTE